LTPAHASAIRYHIGVDGGGTQTRVRLATAAGDALGVAASGPSALGQGIEQAWKHIAQAVESAFTNAGIAPVPREQCAVGIGLAGANVRRRRDDFLALAPLFAHLALDTDAYTALLGAHEGRPGAIVTAGTGSVGEAFHRDGMRVAAGGWGFPVGDEGSGAWLGLHAMRETHRAIDGRGPVGPLVGAVIAVAGTTREALLAWCDRPGQNAYAELAPLVFDAAGADPAAAHLLDRAARALEEIAAALDPQATLPLAICGTVGQKLLPRFDAAIRARRVEPAGDAVDGAFRLLRQSLNGSRG
jgi:glucosamine kinase